MLEDVLTAGEQGVRGEGREGRQGGRKGRKKGRKKGEKGQCVFPIIIIIEVTIIYHRVGRLYK